MVTAKVRKM